MEALTIYFCLIWGEKAPFEPAKTTLYLNITTAYKDYVTSCKRFQFREKFTVRPSGKTIHVVMFQNGPSSQAARKALKATADTPVRSKPVSVPNGNGKARCARTAASRVISPNRPASSPSQAP